MNHTSPRGRILQLLFVAYWLGLFALTHLPKLPNLPGPPFKDKLAHLFTYAGLMALALATRAKSARSAFRLVAIWLPLLAVYAAIDELLQPFVHRTADINDWLADLAGLLIVAACYLVAKSARSAIRPAR